MSNKKTLYNKEYYKKNRDRLREYSARYCKENKDKIRDRTKRYQVEYNKKHKDEIKEYRDNYRMEHKEYFKIFLKKWRHTKGVNKSYNNLSGLCKIDRKRYCKEWKIKNRFKIKVYNFNRRTLEKNAGKITVNTIQLIYEANIKKYSTLTCYLCLKSIQFGQDCLEHKIPLSRGGSNEQDNLAIAHRSCNCAKHDKTLEEFNEYKKGLSL